jgi:predicted dehydrogenase
MGTSVAVMGAGVMGIVHAKKLSALLPQEQIIICDAKAERREVAARECPLATIVADVADVIAQKPPMWIVAVNTPSHLNIMQSALEAGAEHIMTEKPLVLSSQIRLSRDVLRSAKTLVTAWVIECSPALARLREIMDAQSLAAMRAFVLWKKDRSIDGRPTPGDEEDEWPHGVLAARRLFDINQTILGESVSADLSYEEYVNQEQQLEARSRDSSFPIRPGASTFGTAFLKSDLLQDIGRISGYSSYLGYQQERVVEVLFTHTGRIPTHKARLEFDTPEGDILRFNTIGGKAETEERTTWKVDKALLQMEAFLNFARTGERDARLVHLDEAMLAVRRTAAVIRSASNKGTRVRIA